MLVLSTPSVNWVNSGRLIRTLFTPSLQKDSISKAEEGVHTSIPTFNEMGMMFFAVLNSSTEVTKERMIPMLFNPCECNLRMASTSHFRISGSSSERLMPLHPSRGFFSLHSPSTSSVLTEKLLYQTVFG